MSKTVRTILIVLGVVVLAGAGFALWRTSSHGTTAGYPADVAIRNNGGMMGYANPNAQRFPGGPGMMGGDYGMGSGSVEGYGGMMGNSRVTSDTRSLSVDEAREAVESYLASFTGGDADLDIEEIMVFSNNAYAIVVEKDTGIGAFELLVDPETKAVFPEYGPNMMWNQKYGMMMGGSGIGVTMGGFGSGPAASAGRPAGMSVSPDEALKAAQRYLDRNSPGVKVSDEITAFYGYYTIDLEKDGRIVGMLSVNGSTGEVFPHTWHGDFVEMVSES